MIAFKRNPTASEDKIAFEQLVRADNLDGSGSSVDKRVAIHHCHRVLDLVPTIDISVVHIDLV